jgi:DNA-binding NarL/FixJ family response regulator
MGNNIRVLIADDHEIVRLGLTQALTADGRFEICGQASNGAEAVEMASKLIPDVLLLDITMPGLDGFEVIDELRRRNHRIKTVFLTMHTDESMMERALASGIEGYMLKNLPKEDIIAAIVKVAGGRKAIHESVFHTIGQKYALSMSKDASGLTRREREILRLIVDGLTSAQIAQRLYISPRTVDTHRANMMQKLGLNNVAALVRFALDSKIFEKVQKG